jgi:ADP-ribosylglycohydrolase
MLELNIDKLNQQALGSLMAVVIGDVYGLPVECQSPINIRTKVGYVDHPIACSMHPYPQVAKKAAGTISDDSQLTFAMMASLQRQKGYNLLDIKKAHIEAADGAFGPPVGWGGSTKSAVEAMRLGHSATMVAAGAGNGPIIKLAPLAIYCVYRCYNTPHRRFTNSFNASLLCKCREISHLTHGDPGCIVAAYCQCRMLIRALQHELPKESVSIANLFIQDAEWAELKIKSDTKMSDRLKEILQLRSEIIVGGQKTQLTAFDLATEKMSVLITTERSSYIYNSYPLVAYCVAKYLPYNNFRHALLETVNAGADADSNASMVGSIIGAHLGFDAIPIDMVKCTAKWDKLLANIRNFIQNL